jgi:RimJ/RimL family protein N-acetyltransferase
MAIMPPAPLELLRRPTPGLDGLKPQTRALLVGKRRRARARLTQPIPWEVSPYTVQDHGPDFLLYAWHLVQQAGEHATLWGALGLSPSKFLAAFLGVEVIVCHLQHAPWTQGQGILFLMWSDDVVPELRARVHFWCAPAYRTPSLSLGIGRAMLDYYFGILGYHLLEGRTPVTNRLALRYITRLGFQLGIPLPNAEWVTSLDGKTHMGAVIPSFLTREAWQEGIWARS